MVLLDTGSRNMIVLIGGMKGALARSRLANVIVRDRIAYRKAAKDGLAVIELKPKDFKAVEEMEILYKE